MTKFLKLHTDHSEDLSFLNELKTEIVNEFCKVSISFIKGGANQRIISKAAQKLKVKERDVEKSIKALSFLFSECAKSKLTVPEFKLMISELDLPEETKKLILELYKKNRKEIRNLYIQSDNFFGIPQYKDLSWRLDVVLGKRNMGEIIEPNFTMKLNTSIDKEVTGKFFSVEYNDLKHCTNQLENALTELKNVHVRRIRKYIKV